MTVKRRKPSVKEIMRQRLPRGTTVTVTDSFGKAALRGAQMIVASKGPVKCNKGGRCAGKWCVGLAVFVAAPATSKEDKEMGWRGGTTKVCLTHLRDTDNDLVIATPLSRKKAKPGPKPAKPELGAVATAITSSSAPVYEGVVTWEQLAHAAADRDFEQVTRLARQLKSENEVLKTQMIELQGKLLSL